MSLSDSCCLLKPRIYVISPNGQQQCAGEYKQSQDSANGCPVRQEFGGSIKQSQLLRTAWK